MEMHATHAGKLRAIGYDAARRLLRVELDDGTALEYANVGESVWRQFKSTSAQWSFYRDNIEETFTASRAAVVRKVSGGKNPLDDLFG